MALKSPGWQQWRYVAPASCLARNQSDVSWCLYLEERLFLYSVGIQTTSKHWASVVSACLPCAHRRDVAGVRSLRVCPLWGTWPVYFFLYWGWHGDRAQKQDLEQFQGIHVEWCCAVSVLSLPVNLYNLFFSPVLLVETCFCVCVVCMFCSLRPLLSFVPLPFSVFIFRRSFFISKFPCSCYCN